AQRMLEFLRCDRVESFQVARGWLNLLSSVMKLSQISDDVVANRSRHAPTQIVWEPPAIRSPNEVIRDHDWIHELSRGWKFDHIHDRYAREAASGGNSAHLRLLSTH